MKKAVEETECNFASSRGKEIITWAPNKSLDKQKAHFEHGGAKQ